MVNKNGTGPRRHILDEQDYAEVAGDVSNAYAIERIVEMILKPGQGSIPGLDPYGISIVHSFRASNITSEKRTALLNLLQWAKRARRLFGKPATFVLETIYEELAAEGAVDGKILTWVAESLKSHENLIKTEREQGVQA